jgi:hypothetical protein
MKYGFIGLALAFASAAGATGSGAFIHVANNGLDAPGCGTLASPCRSISMGISNAVEGDTILVRPGLYGELDFDGALGGQGEESGTFGGMIYVNKRVTILSTGGAEVTSLRGVNGMSVVYIAANGVQFGGKNAGFSMSGGVYGIEMSAQTRGKIAGNDIHAPTAGMYVLTDGLLEISDNVVSGSQGNGISVQSTNSGSGAVILHDNVVLGTEFSTGISLSPLGAHRVYNNTVKEAFYGIVVPPGPSRVYQNTVTNNRIGIGYANYPGTEPPGGTGGLPVISRNNLVGNIGSGFLVFPGAAHSVTLRENNIYGNGVCGVAGNAVVAVDARNNYWGAPTGPSFTNPADPVCDQNNNVQFAPFSSREFLNR